MKIMFLVLGLGLLSAALFARDLPGLARREKARRRELSSHSRPAPSFDDSDLERYQRARGEAGPDVVSRHPAPDERRDIDTERRHWREETERHERELARLDASIRKLEWRLAERRDRRKNGERLRGDTTADMLEDSIENLREQRRLLDERFRDRARRAGAFPGWLR